MYGATKPKITRPDPRGDNANDPNVEMQPLMVDPYFDKSFSPEVKKLDTIFIFNDFVNHFILEYMLNFFLPHCYRTQIAQLIQCVQISSSSDYYCYHFGDWYCCNIPWFIR